jgi:hypothetical protein
MRLRVKMVWFLAMLFALSSGLAAQTPAPSPPHQQAARELFEMIGGKDLAKTASMVILSQLASNPELARYEDIFKAWVEKIYAGDNIGKEIARLYTEAFTEDELRQLIAFYKTPVGQKALQKMPELMQKGMAYGQKLAEAHLPELQSMIAARKKELEAKEQKPPQ